MHWPLAGDANAIDNLPNDDDDDIPAKGQLAGDFFLSSITLMLTLAILLKLVANSFFYLYLFFSTY